MGAVYLVPTIVECVVVILVFLLHYKSAALALLVFVKCETIETPLNVKEPLESPQIEFEGAY